MDYTGADKRAPNGPDQQTIASATPEAHNEVVEMHGRGRAANAPAKGVPMETEYLHRAGRRIVLEVFNAGSVEMLEALISPDFVDHGLPPGVPPNREGLKSMIAALRVAFPDLEYTIEDQIAEGNKLAQRITGRGTMKGEFMGMQPTGKTAAWEEVHFHRFDANGQLVEHWDITDSLGMLIQLGLGRAPG